MDVRGPRKSRIGWIGGGCVGANAPFEPTEDFVISCTSGP
jgi:hypothetical protein